jgi:hypothetical protein
VAGNKIFANVDMVGFMEIINYMTGVTYFEMLSGDTP